ncbi:MAG: NADH dehydrogenase (quinone) subunit D [Sedimentisphaerales bacterium]|nr:NADH dehydrogenase (quinone) subunit D [Sedimentisphaerales bacterium]
MTATKTLKQRYAPHPVELERDPGSPDSWILHFGPQHPATHTTIHLVLQLDGERILNVTPHIGYLHSGFEKLSEHHTYDQYVTVTDRMNYVSPMANNIAWHGAVEKLLGIEITPRCRYVRTVIAEMARIQDHLLCIGEAALDVGAMTAFVFTFNDRELIMDLFERLCGARYTTSWTRIGGAMADIPDGWVDGVRQVTRRLPGTLADCRTLLTRNRIFVERTKNVAVLGRDEAIGWGWTGPVARASGVERDLRKDEPYLAYGDLDFQVPIARGGDAYSRYLVRMEEMEQSLRIIRQAVENIPAGEINARSDHKTLLPDKNEVYGSIEGLIHHFEDVMDNRGFATPLAEVYAAQETANGELGFYLVADGTHRPWRAKTRGPSFAHLASVGRLLRGHTISEIVVALPGLNIIAAELDR